MINRLVLIACSIIVLHGCTPSKRLSYFHDLSDTARLQTMAVYPYKPLKLISEDQVQITISSTSPEASQYFNLGVATASATTAGNTAIPSAGIINVYTVSNSGNITLPVLGDIPASGLTVEELKQKIIGLIKPYLKDAVISTKLVNVKVTVIGEVGRTTVIPVNGEQINIVEALSASGDMTPYGKRYDVKVMRRTKDSMAVANLDFNSSKIFTSPYFQLQQNDIVYVEPTARKEKTTRLISPVVGVVLGVVGILIGALNIFLR